MKECLDGNLGYCCCDALKLVKTYIPNDKNKTEATFSQSFYLASLIINLLELDEENSKDKINSVLLYHKKYLDDMGSITTSCILTLNKEVYEVENIHIRSKLELFSKLAAYTKNPMEPIFKLLIKPTKYRNSISDLISAICRGDHISVKMDLYALEDIILKEAK